MTERSAMKRRVRGLLHRKWHGPLLALVVVALPLAVVGALVVWLLGLPTMQGQLVERFANAQGVAGWAVQVASLLYSLDSLDYTGIIAGLPGLAVLAGVWLFIFLPLQVSLSGYFLSFLRGKNPRVRDAYSVFSAKYPRALGGMLYMLLWLLLWGLLTIAVPAALYMGGERLNAWLTASTTLNVSMIAFAVELILCLLAYVIFTLVFINRMLAYALTPICLAAQPRLPAYRAVRLSRKLMRGSKWRLVLLVLSFLTYYLPALIAFVLWAVLPMVAPLLGLSEFFQSGLRLFLLIVMAVNQVVLVYVAPYMTACVHAFYIERKREALMDEEVTPDDFVKHAHE